MTPKIVQISESVASQLTQGQQADLEQMLTILRGWQGSFDEASIGATLYNRWFIQFIRKLYMKYEPDSEDDRMAFSDMYHFTDAFQRIIVSVLEEGDQSRFQTICEGAHASYSGSNHCAYGIAMALVESKEFLSVNVSSNPAKWLWGNLHVNDYANVPWSKTPLKFFFHRSVPVPGNQQTPNVSKISERKNRDSAVMSGYASANFKMLVQLAKDPKDDVSLFSIDTGMHSHPFQGNFFDMNKDHVEGRLKPMKWNADKLAGTSLKTLTLMPK